MTGPTFLRGDRVTLHPVEEADLDFCHRLVNDLDVRQGIAVTSPRTREQERSFRVESDDHFSFLIRAPNGSNTDDAGEDHGGDRGRRVGIADLVHVHHELGTAEVGYFLDPDDWGNGYATAAIECLVRYAFDELRLHKVHARVFGFNDPSSRVLERAGFTREATLPEHAFIDGEYVDTHLYGLIEDDWRDR